MDSRVIVVIGPEGSGTTLVSQCLTGHPGLAECRFWPTPSHEGGLPQESTIIHLSLPSLRPTRWLKPADLPRQSALVVVRRSPVHAVYSAYRRFGGPPRAAWRRYLRAAALESEYVATFNPFCLLYEDLIAHPDKVLEALYTFLGVDPRFRPAIAFQDRNDDRWRRDAPFADHVRKAFGIGTRAAVPDDVPPADVTLQGYGRIVAIDDRSGAGIGALLTEVLPPTFEQLADPEVSGAAASFRIERVSATLKAPLYRVFADNLMRFRARRPDAVARWIAAEVDRLISETSPDTVFVHAGVVTWRGRAIVIPGRTMTGKSTLVAELVRLGATYYSDEFAVLDREGRVLPYARPLALRDDRTSPPVDRALAREAAPIALVVSTTFEAGSSWRPEEQHGVRAVAALIDNAVTARDDSARLLRVAGRAAASGAVGLRGLRPEATDVAPSLLERVDALAAGLQNPPAARAQAAARATAIRRGTIRPPRVVRIPDLLDENTHRELLAYAQAHESTFAASGVLNAAGHAVDEHYRRSGTMRDLGRFRDVLIAPLRRMVPYVRQTLDLPWFSVSRVECEMAVHRGGGFFDCHVDNGYEPVSRRRLTCVYYFHSHPKGFSGGELRLHDAVVSANRVAAGEEQLIVEPADNTAVFFASDTFHQVSPVTVQSSAFGDSRFSVNLWFWAKADEKVEAAASASPELQPVAGQV